MDFESNDRTAGDYILVALAVSGLVIGLAGVILSAAGLAVAGLLILLLSLLVYWVAQPEGV